MYFTGKFFICRIDDDSAGRVKSMFSVDVCCISRGFLSGDTLSDNDGFIGPLPLNQARRPLLSLRLWSTCFDRVINEGEGSYEGARH